MSLTVNVPYLQVPVFAELIARVEANPESAKWVKKMACGILGHYFPVQQGFVISPQRNQDNDKATYFVVRQWRPRLPAGRPIVDHVCVDVRARSDNSPGDQFDAILENSHTENETCWVILIMRLDILIGQWFAETGPEIKSGSDSEGLKFLNLVRGSLEIDSQLREVARTPM